MHLVGIVWTAAETYDRHLLIREHIDGLFHLFGLHVVCFMTLHEQIVAIDSGDVQWNIAKHHSWFFRTGRCGAELYAVCSGVIVCPVNVSGELVRILIGSVFVLFIAGLH